jgi:hypothetical protein
MTYIAVGAISGNTGAAADTLTGPAVDTIWNITSANGGTLSPPNPIPSVAFTGIENLTGGAAVDTFIFGVVGSVSGTVNGGTSSGTIDTLNLASKTAALQFQLSATSTSVSGGTIGVYTGFEQITGTAAMTVARVNNVATAWTVDLNGRIVVSTVTYIGVGNIAGGPGADTITGPALNASEVSTWTITAANAGSLAIPGTTVAFTGVENLIGSTGADAFVINPAGSLSGNLNGGTGTGINSLSYASWTDGVTVNLASTASGNARGITGRTTNIQMVTGGEGNDTLTGQSSRPSILIGLAGTDTLTGGLDRDLLFGGLGVDTMNGGGRDDLMVSGTTSFDINRAAILQIYAEWISTRTFAQRTANIWGDPATPNWTGPGFNGTTYLNNNGMDSIDNTVFDDGVADILTGGLGQDWFFADPAEITDELLIGSTPDRINT